MPVLYEIEELNRIAALKRLQILDTPAEPEFDELVELAAAICNVPISMVSLLDEKRQWFKAAVGLFERETSREVAFCSHAIQQPDIFTVEDATRDSRFSANPLVTGDMGLRFYAGVPVTSTDGYALGTLCVMDTKPRTLSESQRAALRILGRQVNARLELREQRKLLQSALAEAEDARARMVASERRFQTFADSGPFLSYLKDAEGRMLFYNRRFAETFHVSRTAMLGKTDTELWPKEFATGFRAHDLEVLRDKSLKIIEESSPNADGTPTFWRSYRFPCTDADGSPLVGGISVEVTEELNREAKLHQYQAELEAANERLLQLATTDSLTGLANRRAFDERLVQEFSTARRKERALSVMLLDADNFKQRNDLYGHDEGDATLKQLATLLNSLVRESDLVVRYGGEEFVLLLPETDEAGALLLGDRILSAVREQVFKHEAVTLSGGVAGLTTATLNPKQLVSLADIALYAAKREGKDRIYGHAKYRKMMAASGEAS